MRWLKGKYLMKTIFKLLMTILAGIVLGFVLIVLAYTIPVNRIEKNVKSGVERYNDEGRFHEIVPSWHLSWADHFTDSIILSTTMCDSKESLIKRAMKNQRIEYEGALDAYHNLIYYYLGSDLTQGKEVSDTSAYLSPEEEIVDRQNYTPYAYSRYWNGYVVFLKPLLYLFDFSVVYILNAGAQLFLIAAIIYMMWKRNKRLYIIPFVLALISVSPYSSFNSFQLSSIMYITYITLLVMLIKEKEIKNCNAYIYVFAVNGICVAYFDLLTSPVLAIGWPLVLYCIQNKEIDNIKKIKKIFGYSLVWLTSYVLMWFSKIILATMFAGQNVLKNAYEAFVYRSGGKTKQFSNGILSDSSFEIDLEESVKYSIKYKDILVRNLYAYLPIGITIMILVSLVIGLYLVYDSRKKLNRQCWLITLPYIFISLYPFVWLFLFKNHSYCHYYFVSRILSVTLLAVLCMLINICQPENENTA